MNNYKVVFNPLKSAPACQYSIGYSIAATTERNAVIAARAELRKDKLNPQHYKKKAQVRIMENSVIEEIKKTQDLTLDKLNAQIEELKPNEILILDDISNDLYHSSIGISCSQIKLFRECPAKYKAKYIDCIMPEVKKSAFDFGTAVHTITLEPHLFESTVVKQPDEFKTRASKGFKEFESLHVNKIILSAKDHDLVKMANDAVNAHPIAPKLIRGGKAETSIYKRDSETDLIIKCRPDYQINDLIVDVKTASSSEPFKFGRDAKKFGYHLQDAMYRDISGANEFVFLVIENKAPCVVTAPVMMSKQARELGFLQYRQALNELKNALETNNFPNYTNNTVIIELSKFEQNELENLQNGVNDND